ncbi:hypothetical protein SAMN05216233_10434 [Desulfoluna spongiiphila]|uniref:Uncharacterized protein n=1 Tax=Desulfoluna spongiiphila TaxID=419481 RepID=A0A1G5D8A9_9BACT|nr:hypothetical protein SAMN05216233_10434 [Desulfoluna spongiiphila]
MTGIISTAQLTIGIFSPRKQLSIVPKDKGMVPPHRDINPTVVITNNLRLIINRREKIPLSESPTK